MVSRDYTKEIGLPAQNVMVPLPYAIGILAAFAAATWFGIASMQSHRAIAKAESVKAETVQVFVRQ